MCLIGIVIVVTMIMLLQVASVATTKVEDARADLASGLPLDVQERALRDRVASLEVAVRDAQKRPDVDPLSKRSSLRQELRGKATELTALEQQSRELEAQLRELLVANPEAASLREVLELVRIRDDRAAELSKLERRKQISFILDAAEPLRPIVFEVSATRIVVSDAADGASVRIAAGTMAAQCMDALQLFEVLSKDRPSYILMVVSASGVATYRTLMDAILAMPEAERPRIGLDLIPDGSFVSPVFPSSVEAGDA
ncbi:MAG: hypothetical protein EXS10_10710 [Phycisphaerales bacterium]|nr:hypothetical protein [Phycisphaerales bacterium]